MLGSRSELETVPGNPHFSARIERDGGDGAPRCRAPGDERLPDANAWMDSSPWFQQANGKLPTGLACRQVPRLAVAHAAAAARHRFVDAQGFPVQILAVEGGDGGQ